MSIKILIDSGSDITKEEAMSMGVEMIPLIVSFGDEDYYDGVNLYHDEFYKKLKESSKLPKTSQITPIRFEDEFERLTKNGDQLIVITISSKLSGTYSSAVIAAEKYEGKVFVLDSCTVAAGERILAMLALDYINQGLSAEEVVCKLNELKNKITIMAIVDTLEYLKKGGRISSTVAFAGELLSLKPILCVKDGEIEMIGKSLGSRKANKLLNKLILNNGGINQDYPFGVVWSGFSDENVKKYVMESKEILKRNIDEISIYTLGCTIGTHAGPGVIGVAFFEN